MSANVRPQVPSRALGWLLIVLIMAVNLKSTLALSVTTYVPQEHSTFHRERRLNYVDRDRLIRSLCPDPWRVDYFKYPTVAKICNYNERTVGLLCREYCAAGYTEVAGVCWKGINSYVPPTRGKTFCEPPAHNYNGGCRLDCPDGYFDYSWQVRCVKCS